jgi:hypothetical protein
MVFSSALRGFLPSVALVGAVLVAPHAVAAPPGIAGDRPLTTDEGEVVGAEAEADAPAEDAGEGSLPEAAPVDDEARKRAALASFEEARRLFLAEEFAAAAAEFRRSFETFPSLEALVAAARAYARAGDTFAAIDAYEEYAEFEDDNAERYAEAIERLRQLRAEVGELVLRIEDPGQILSMTLNGEGISFDDFPRRMMPGEVALEIRFVDVEKPRLITSRVRRGETTVLEISPRPVVVTPRPVDRPTPSPVVVEEPPKPSSLRGLRVAFWGGVGLTTAAGIAVATLGGLTLRQRQIYYDALCETNVCPEGATYPFAEEARFGELRRATNIVVGVGIGVAVVTLVVGGVLKRKQRARRKSAGIELRRGALTLRF